MTAREEGSDARNVLWLNAPEIPPNLRSQTRARRSYEGPTAALRRRFAGRSQSLRCRAGRRRRLELPTLSLVLAADLAKGFRARGAVRRERPRPLTSDSSPSAWARPADQS